MGALGAAGSITSFVEASRHDYFARQFAVDAALRLGADRYGGDVDEMLHCASQIFKFVTGKDTSSAS